jgi:hypothetical protein
MIVGGRMTGGIATPQNLQSSPKKIQKKVNATNFSVRSQYFEAEALVPLQPLQHMSFRSNRGPSFLEHTWDIADSSSTETTGQTVSRL